MTVVMWVLVHSATLKVKLNSLIFMKFMPVWQSKWLPLALVSTPKPFDLQLENSELRSFEQSVIQLTDLVTSFYYIHLKFLSCLISSQNKLDIHYGFIIALQWVQNCFLIQSLAKCWFDLMTAAAAMPRSSNNGWQRGPHVTHSEKVISHSSL